MSNKNQVQQEAVKEDLIPELQSVFENIAKKEGYITYEIITTKFDSGGANFLGELFEVDIKGITKDGDKETNIFLKKAGSDDALGNVVGMANVYESESFVYQDLAKRFHILQNEANVPEQERYRMVKSYESHDATTIILENVAKKGYKIPDRMDVVSLKYAELCMEQLAKFHALSFVLKIKHSDYFENKVRPIKYPMKDDNEAARLHWDNLAKITVKNLDSCYKRKAETIMAAFHEKYIQYFMPQYSSVTCLCHGDFRTSNILTRENQGQIAEVLPLDYQCIYFGCPVNDILFFMAFGTDRKFRAQHFENLKTLYYDTLTNFLKYFNIDSNDIFPRKEMDDLFHQRVDFVAMLALTHFAFIFVPENESTNPDYNLDERYKERFIEILEDFPLQESV